MVNKVSAPTNWREWLAEQNGEQKVSEPQPVHVVPNGLVKRNGYANRALQNEITNVLNAPEGTRNHTLNVAAFNLAGFIASGHLQRDDVNAGLVDAATIAGLEPFEIEATIRSGFNAGVQHPRTVPEPVAVEPLAVFRVPPNAVESPQGEETEEWQHPYTDLGWVARGETRPVHPPTLGWRVDGAALLYTGRINGIFGSPETAKTWLALHFKTQILNNGGKVGLIDIDHNGANDTQARLIKLGVAPEVIGDPKRFRYYEPEDLTELQACVQNIIEWEPDMLTVDSIGELLPMLGLDSNSNDDITRAYRHIINPMAQDNTAVFTIDHLPKNTEGEHTYAIGGIAKKRAMNGLLIYANARLTPAPNAVGKITLTVAKDRSGLVRENAVGGTIGTFTMDSTNVDGFIDAGITKEIPAITNTGEFRPTHIMEQVSKFIETEMEGANRSTIYANIGGKRENVTEATNVLIREKYALVVKARGGDVVKSTRPYREAQEQTPPMETFGA